MIFIGDFYNYLVIGELNMPQVWVPDYPEADGKITYYAVIISDLNRYKSEAEEAIKNIYQTDYRNKTTEFLTAAGPYYDIFVTQNDKWFDDLSSLKIKLGNFVNIIENRIKDAEDLKEEWKEKKKLGHMEER